MPGPLGCDREEARRYLGLSENMFVDYTRRGIIRRVRKGYYHYADLYEAAAAMRRERDRRSTDAGHDEEAGGARKAPKPVGGQGDRSYDGETEELLRVIG